MEKVLRSFIHEKFSHEMRVQIELLSRRRDISNGEKHEEIIKLLQNSDIGEFSRLGPGTNRYAVKMDGFVVKVATDHDGKIDNFKEFKMAKRLFPHVAKTYEVAENGTLLIAEYVPPFESYTEMCRYAPQIREILQELSSVYLIGDVGISPNNFSNWGIRVGTNQPVCLDFAYVYEVSSKLFLCKQCKSNSMLVPDSDFNILICPRCKHQYAFADIRAKIGNDLHRHEIGDLSEEGYRLMESFVPTTLTESRSNYLVKKGAAKKKKTKATAGIKEEQKMEKSELVKDMAGTPFSPAPICITAVSRPMKAGDAYNVTAVSAPAVEEPDEVHDDTPIGAVAFSCAMDQNGVIQGTSAPPQEVIQRPDLPGGFIDLEPSRPAVVMPPHEPVITDPTAGLPAVEPQEEEVVESTPAQTAPAEMMDIPDGFMEHHAEAAISKFSNKFDVYMRSIKLYEQVKSWLTSKKRIVSEEDFYRTTQNTIYRSLAIFMNFKETTKPKSNGQGNVKTFVPQEDPHGKPYFPTLLFFARLWEECIIRDQADAKDIITVYRNTHSTYMGIQPEWREVFVRRLRGKLAIDLMGSNYLADLFAKEFCTEDLPEPPADAAPEEPNEVPETTTPLDNCLEALNRVHATLSGADDFSTDDMTEIVLFREIKGGTEFEIYVDLVKIAILGTVAGAAVMRHSYQSMEEAAQLVERDAVVFYTNLKKAMDQYEYTAPFYANMGQDGADGDGGDEEDDDGSIYAISVEIRRGDDFDYVRLVARDPDDVVSIPFYTKLDDPNPDSSMPQATVQVNASNGSWDWLTQLAPRMIFMTNDPMKYLKINDLDTDGVNEARFVILDREDSGEFVMGLYILEGIFEINDDGELENCYTPEIINKINSIVMYNLPYSAMSFHPHYDELDMIDESDIADIIDELDLTGDDGDDEEDVPSDMGSLSAAAINIMRETENIGDEVVEVTPQVAIPVQPAQAPTTDRTPAAQPAQPQAGGAGLWKPIRRPSSSKDNK